jgi:hypothetical protein
MDAMKVFDFPVGFTGIDTSTTATKALLMGNARVLHTYDTRPSVILNILVVSCQR